MNQVTIYTSVGFWIDILNLSLTQRYFYNHHLLLVCVGGIILKVMDARSILVTNITGTKEYILTSTLFLVTRDGSNCKEMTSTFLS